MIFVTNRNPEAYRDRFDGVDYAFPPGEKVPIEEEAAAHIFGWGRADKTENLVRMGRANSDAGPQWLSRFQFTAAKLIEDSPKIDGMDKVVEQAQKDVTSLMEDAKPSFTGGATSLLDKIPGLTPKKPAVG